MFGSWIAILANKKLVLDFSGLVVFLLPFSPKRMFPANSPKTLILMFLYVPCAAASLLPQPKKVERNMLDKAKSIWMERLHLLTGWIVCRREELLCVHNDNNISQKV